jgi:ABC-type molybdate transport system substrate-binding protein
VAGHDTPSAKALLDALRSSTAKSTWEKYGFTPY